MKNLNKKFLLFFGAVILLFAGKVHVDKNLLDKEIFAQIALSIPINQDQFKFVAGDASGKEDDKSTLAVNDQIVEEEEDFKDNTPKKEKSEKPLVSTITGFVISLLNYHIIHHFYETVDCISANPIYLITCTFRL